MKKTKLKLWRTLLYLMVFGFGSVAVGQNTVNISGVVTAAEDGQPVPGVNVVVKGTTNGTSTDFDGNYVISATSNDILVFSSIGYKTVEIAIGNQTVIDLAMEVDAQQLDDVVVIGYGTSKKSDLTGAIASVSADDFQSQPLVRAEDALQARAAGVQVLKTSGAPGGDVKIRIRGSNSITGNNDPLVVIDGIIGGNLSSINTNDIESLDILKDASATAIYGSRGANGVIIVTTKRGGSTPALDVNYFMSVSSVPEKIDLLTPQQFAQINDKEVVNGGTDYQDEYFQTGITNNLQLSTSGREGKIGYFLSGNYVDQTGIVFNTNYERFSLRSNLNIDISDRFSVGLNIYGSREKSLNLVDGGARTADDARAGITAVLGWDPSTAFRNVDGSYNLQSDYGSNLVNPIAVQNERDGNLIEDNFNANLNLSYDLTDNFNFTVLGGTLLRHFNNETFRGIPDGTSLDPSNSTFSSRRSSDYQLSNILTWDKDFGNNNLKITGIYELQSSEDRLESFSSSQYAISPLSEAFFLSELGQTQVVGANFRKSNLQSYVGRAEFNMANELLVTGTIRVDQSSRFRKDNRTGYFPSVSLGYNLSQFIKEDGFVSNIKLRAGYGETGNQDIPPYSTYQSLPTGRNYFFNGSSFDIGLGNPPLVDENLTWETTKQFNVGADFTFLDGRLRLNADWYKKNTVDLLLDLPVPDFAGGGTIRTNAGEVQNSGFDINLDAVLVDSDDLSWNANLNFSKVNTEVVDLGGQEQIILRPPGINPAGRGDNLYIIEEGQPLGQFYGATFLGTYKTADAAEGVPGTPRYLEDDEGVVLGVIGNGIPDFSWGLNTSLEWKGFDLNVLLRGVHGFDVLNVSRGLISLGGGNIRQATSAEFLNRWTPENETEIPASGENFVANSRYVEDGSFISLSNLSLGYTLPNVPGLKSLRVYVSGQNLFKITDYKGYDPEVSATGSSVAADGTQASDATPSLDYGAFPNPRTITLGLNLGF